MSSSSYLAQQNYKIVNLSLAGIILCIFSYATLFSPEESKHPIPSFYTQITKETSPSTGLSRCFSAIVRGNLQLAKTFNPYGLAIFLFFVVQFVFRVFSFIWINERYSWIKPYVLIDILFSTIGFYFAFKPLIFFTLKLFRETIVN